MGLEYYGSTGPLFKYDPFQQQQHQLFLVTDLNLGQKWEFNAGYGLAGPYLLLVMLFLLMCYFGTLSLMKHRVQTLPTLSRIVGALVAGIVAITGVLGSMWAAQRLDSPYLTITLVSLPVFGSTWAVFEWLIRRQHALRRLVRKRVRKIYPTHLTTGGCYTTTNSQHITTK